MKKLSVIVPIYNVEKYLEQCVNSIINQTYTNLEIILVDDGSNDGCREMSEAYAKQDERIVVIHKANGGLSDARNAGIDRATGDYLAFIDADDYIDRTMFFSMISALEATRADIAICNFDCVDEEGALIDEKNREARIVAGELTSGQALDMLCKTWGHYYVIACNKIYKKELFKELRFSNGKLHEDEFIVHEVFSRMEKMICLEEAFYKYVQRNDSITKVSYSIRHLDAVEALFLRTRFFINANSEYNAKYTFALATGIFIKLVQSIELQDEAYANRVNELRTMCRYIFRDIPKTYFRFKLWFKCFFIIYCPYLLKFRSFTAFFLE